MSTLEQEIDAITKYYDKAVFLSDKEREHHKALAIKIATDRASLCAVSVGEGSPSPDKQVPLVRVKDEGLPVGDASLREEEARKQHGGLPREEFRPSPTNQITSAQRVGIIERTDGWKVK